MKVKSVLTMALLTISFSSLNGGEAQSNYARGGGGRAPGMYHGDMQRGDFGREGNRPLGPEAGAYDRGYNNGIDRNEQLNRQWQEERLNAENQNLWNGGYYEDAAPIQIYPAPGDSSDGGPGNGPGLPGNGPGYPSNQMPGLPGGPGNGAAQPGNGPGYL